MLLTEAEAIQKADEMRNDLVEGAEIISSFGPLDSEEDYEQLYKQLEHIPGINMVWRMKYYQMLFPALFAPFYGQDIQLRVLHFLNQKPSDIPFIRMGQISLYARKCNVPGVVFAHIYGKNVGYTNETNDSDTNTLSDKKHKTHYWMYTVFDDKSWNECQQKGIMVLGMDDIGDYSQFASKEALRQELIDVYDSMNSSLLHSLNFAMDAQYVLRQSISGKKTHELRCERKELSAKDCSFGYNWNRDSKTITINKDQAKVIVRIFEDYVYRNGTPASIQRTLKAEGISVCGRTISNIIKDERYIGKFYINKRTTKLGTGRNKSRRIKLPKDQWVLVERPDLQIIDTELFEMAQRIHQTRITVYEKPDKKNTQVRFQGTHKFAGKIFCPVCGKPYNFGYADRNKTIPIYRIKSHSECTNPIRRIYESDMEEITRQALKTILNEQNEVCISLEKILTECVEASQNSGNEIDKLKKKKISKEKQIDSLIDTLSEGGLTASAKEHIKDKINAITDEIDKLIVTINDKESSKLNVSYVNDKIAEIKEAIADLRNFTSIDRDRILNYIERIELPPSGNIEMLLKTGHKITIDNTSNIFSAIDNAGKNGIQDGPC